MSLITKDYLTAQEVASLKNVTRRTVYSWARLGIIPGVVKFAGCFWFERQAAVNFVPPKRGVKGAGA